MLEYTKKKRSPFNQATALVTPTGFKPVTF